MDKPVMCGICGKTEFEDMGDLFQCACCKRTYPKLRENEELMERAESLRFKAKDFDEAAAMYGEIISLSPDEAEAYWGRVLCRFGVEYVKDENGKYLPICHRTIEGSVSDDADYKMAMLKAQGGMVSYYKEQAELIDEYQEKIKLIASKEEPYDVFICFRADGSEKAEEDRATARSLELGLKMQRLKVFFYDEALKDKAEQESEPIIYAALSGATVMVLVGTSVENINSARVKNEWSSYIKMISEAREKGKIKYLVTVVNGLDPEQLPSDLEVYQAFDLRRENKMLRFCSVLKGVIGDLPVSDQKTQEEDIGSISTEEMLNAEAKHLCFEGYLRLVRESYEEADSYFLRALGRNPKLAKAIWGRVLATEECTEDVLMPMKLVPLKESFLYKQAIRYASEAERKHYEWVAGHCQKLYESRVAKKKTRDTNLHNPKDDTMPVFDRAKEKPRDTNLNNPKGDTMPIFDRAKEAIRDKLNETGLSDSTAPIFDKAKEAIRDKLNETGLSDSAAPIFGKAKEAIRDKLNETGLSDSAAPVFDKAKETLSGIRSLVSKRNQAAKKGSEKDSSKK